MFGVGAQEIVIIVVVLLIVFGPAKLGHMAKEVGRFAYLLPAPAPRRYGRGDPLAPGGPGLCTNFAEKEILRSSQ
jgi:hypothetical protein